MWKQLCAPVSRILDAGFKILILHAGYCILDAAWMLDLGSWIPNAPGSWVDCNGSSPRPDVFLIFRYGLMDLEGHAQSKHMVATRRLSWSMPKIHISQQIRQGAQFQDKI